DVLSQARRSFPFIERIFADSGYQGPRAAAAAAQTGSWTLEIVKRVDAHRLRRRAQAVGGRAHPRLDQPLSPPRPRLRTLCQDRRCLLPSCDDPSHAPQAHTANSLIVTRNFVDRLLATAALSFALSGWSSPTSTSTGSASLVTPTGVTSRTPALRRRRW